MLLLEKLLDFPLVISIFSYMLFLLVFSCVFWPELNPFG